MMTTFISQNELGRRLSLAPATLKSRLVEKSIEPAGCVVNGQRPPLLIFDAAKLPELRRALVPVVPVEASTH